MQQTQVKRYLMSQYQLKNFLVDVGRDRMLHNFITDERQEVIITLSDFIRIVNEEFSKITDEKHPKVQRALTINKYPIVLYTGLVNYLQDIVTVLDRTKESIEIITNGKYMTSSQVHDIMNDSIPGISEGVINRFGLTISMMYECFLINTILLNYRAYRVPYIAQDEYGYLMQKKMVQPVKIVPKVGPELACLLNFKTLDYNSFSLSRDLIDSQGRKLFCSLPDNNEKVARLKTKSSKIHLSDLLSSKGFTGDEIKSAESFYISHASRLTESPEAISELSDYLNTLTKYIRTLRFLESDTRSFNQQKLNYLVDFE